MRLTRPRLFEPLRQRDFALLTAGWTVSFLGDGFFSVALAWQVYKLSNTPTALSLVSIAWSLPTICLLLVGGVVGDRLDRRRVMATSDLLRAASIGAVGVLSVSDRLQLWH
jgi:MFS family permease